MSRTCATPACGAVIPPQKGPARPRKYCEVCRPPRHRKNPRVIELPQPDVQVPVVGPEIPALAEAYRKQLELADRLDTPEGAHVMLLAMLFASGQHTAAGAASLSRELRSAMETALRGAAKATDAVDELTARRRQKATGA